MPTDSSHGDELETMPQSTLGPVPTDSSHGHESTLGPVPTDSSHGDEYTLGPAECFAECCNGTGTEVVQITNASILKSTRKLQGKKWRQFSPNWYKDYKWLVLCSTRLKAFCSYCQQSDKKGLLSENRMGGGDAFLSSGFDNWKKARESFTVHEKSAVHREAMLKSALVKQPSIATQLSNQARQEQQFNREMLLKEISSLRFLLRQGIAVRVHEEDSGNLSQLMLLRSEDCPSFKKWLETEVYFS